MRRWRADDLLGSKAAQQQQKSAPKLILSNLLYGAMLVFHRRAHVQHVLGLLLDEFVPCEGQSSTQAVSWKHVSSPVGILGVF